MLVAKMLQFSEL